MKRRHVVKSFVNGLMVNHNLWLTKEEADEDAKMWRDLGHTVETMTPEEAHTREIYDWLAAMDDGNDPADETHRDYAVLVESVARALLRPTKVDSRSGRVTRYDLTPKGREFIHAVEDAAEKKS